MLEELYTIGKFAAINKISTRMLRHYDKINLLKPKIINNNGYRMYSSEQISTISKIKNYRACQFSLEEIRELLQSSDDKTTKKMASEKIQELEKQESNNHESISLIRELIDERSIESYKNNYEISITEKQESLILATKNYCSEEDIEKVFKNLMDFIEENNILQVGVSCLLFNIENNNGYKVGIPVEEVVVHELYEGILVKKGLYLSTFHYGEYNTIPFAYDKICLYARKNSINIDNTFIERYFVDSYLTLHPREYITDISVIMSNDDTP